MPSRRRSSRLHAGVPPAPPTDWKSDELLGRGAGGGRVKVGSQQSTGKLAADIPAIGPFPEVKLSEVPADSLLLTDAGAILPIEVGYYTFDDTEA